MAPRFFSALNHALTSVDRAPEATRSVADIAETITADIENDAWPLTGRSFDGVVVTNYLWRPLWPLILNSVKPGGVLLYETFAQGNEAYGKPSRPDFLLAPAELLQVCAGWNIVAYEHGLLHPRGGEPLPAMGEAVWLVPGHCDPTVNLHEHLLAVRGGLDAGTVEAVWTIDARGRLD